MKILLVAPLIRKMSPEITAARPRLVYDLAVSLMEKGHKVSILGTGNSKVAGATIIPVIPKSIIEMDAFENPFIARTAFLTKQAKILEKIGDQFDIVHNHARPEFFNLFAAERIKTPMLTTVHAVFEKDTDEAIALFKNQYIVAISKSAAKLAKKTKIYQIIYNGIDTDLYKFNAKKSDYLLWLGRLSQAKNKDGSFMDPKGVRWAIKLAKATGSKLMLAGNVEDVKFFNKDVKPHLNDKIKWVGPISKEQPLSKKQVVKLMGEAKAFLMTINWQEPFGLVMAEAMSTGTPVIGFNNGAVSELVINGKTGFVVNPKNGLAGLKKALKNINQIEPMACREHIKNNFSLAIMVRNYENTYEKIIKKTK